MHLRALLGHLDIRASGGDLNVDVHAVTRDSREAGPGVVFAAVRGARVDGHALVAALPPGSVALVEEPVAVPEGVSWAQVGDTRIALARTAAALAGWPSEQVRVVGVTGTNGKTTVTTLIAQALDLLGHTTARIGTTGVCIAGRELPPGLTTPEAPQLQGWFRELADAGGDVAAMEVSSIGLDQRRVDGTAFSVGVFTMLGRDHLDYHGTMAAYVGAKARLFTDLLRPAGGSPRALLCGDDEHWRALQPPEDRWLYGMAPGSDVHVTAWAPHAGGTTVTVTTPMGEATIASRLVGRHNVLNIAGALGVLLLLGESLSQAASALGQVQGPPGRLEPVPNAHGITVLVDYAHTPDALQAAIDSVRAAVTGAVWVVFGCGGDRDPGKRPHMGRVALSADHVVVTSDNPRSEAPEAIVADILAGIPDGGAVVELDRGRAIALAIQGAKPGDAVLLAGKGHETYQDVAGQLLPFDDRLVAAAALEAL